MGDKEQAILKTVYATGQDVPEGIANAPSLEPGLSLYWWAFWELSTDREGGFGVLPIPWSSIKDFAEAYDLDLPTTETLFHHVRGMDRAYRAHCEKLSKKNKK